MEKERLKKDEENTEQEIEFRRAMGRRLREFREHLEYSQDEMSELLGYTTSRYYGDVERGEAGMSLERMRRLYEKTGMDLTFLITGEQQVVYNLDVILSGCRSDKVEHLRRIVDAAVELAGQ